MKRQMALTLVKAFADQQYAIMRTKGRNLAHQSAIGKSIQQPHDWTEIDLFARGPQDTATDKSDIESDGRDKSAVSEAERQEWGRQLSLGRDSSTIGGSS